jgi:hypothetical protein
MKPLEMNNSAASYVRLKDSTNIIAPHVPMNGKLKVIRRYQNQLLTQQREFIPMNDLRAIMQMNNGNTVQKINNYSVRKSMMKCGNCKLLFNKN